MMAMKKVGENTDSVQFGKVTLAVFRWVDRMMKKGHGYRYHQKIEQGVTLAEIAREAHQTPLWIVHEWSSWAPLQAVLHELDKNLGTSEAELDRVAWQVAYGLLACEHPSTVVGGAPAGAGDAE